MNKKGFTLLELLMVMLVIGILASFAIPEYASVTERALWPEANVQIAFMKKSQEIFFLEHSRYANNQELFNQEAYPMITDIFSYPGIIGHGDAQSTWGYGVYPEPPDTPEGVYCIRSGASDPSRTAGITGVPISYVYFLDNITGGMEGSIWDGFRNGAAGIDWIQR